MLTTALILLAIAVAIGGRPMVRAARLRREAGTFAGLAAEIAALSGDALPGAMTVDDDRTAVRLAA